MVLPFVRELFADVEKMPAWMRAVSRLKTAAGRVGVSGLTPTAKALLISLLQRASGRTLVLVTLNNRAAEDLVPVVQSFCELTGGAPAEAVLALPTRDVLPFQNLSPHPEIQEARATALWKIASGAARIVITPVLSSALRLRSADYYAGLARVVRRGEPLDIDQLMEHLNSVGYGVADIVEMPGEYARRGGILDVYPAEADRPLRIEFFGDEVESVRKFDPATQRSAGRGRGGCPVASDRHSRDGGGAGGDPCPPERQAHLRRGGGCGRGGAGRRCQRVSRMGVLRSSGGTGRDRVRPAARSCRPGGRARRCGAELKRQWERLEQTHERSGIGNLVRPEDLYLSPDDWKECVAARPGRPGAARHRHMAERVRNRFWRHGRRRGGGRGNTVEIATRPPPASTAPFRP